MRLDWRENSIESWLFSRGFLYGVFTLPVSFSLRDMWRSVARRKCPRVLALLFTRERSVANKRVSRKHVLNMQSFEHFAHSELTLILFLGLNSKWVQSTRKLTALTGLFSLVLVIYFHGIKIFLPLFFFINFHNSAHIWLRRLCYIRVVSLSEIPKLSYFFNFYSF